MFFRKARQTGNDNVPAPAAPTVVGKDSTFEGIISTDGEVQVDGLVRGSIRARTCVIDTNGMVEGEVSAEDVIVRGHVVGPIRGLHVHLQQGANVEGDIVNQSIAVDNGAHLHGSVWRSDDPLGMADSHEATAANGGLNTLLASPLWGDGDGFRPLKAIRPRG